MATPAPVVQDAELAVLVLDYLQRAGFAQAAAALELEAAALINSFVGPIGESLPLKSIVSEFLRLKQAEMYRQGYMASVSRDYGSRASETLEAVEKLLSLVASHRLNGGGGVMPPPTRPPMLPRPPTAHKPDIKPLLKPSITPATPGKANGKASKPAKSTAPSGPGEKAAAKPKAPKKPRVSPKPQVTPAAAGPAPPPPRAIVVPPTTIPAPLPPPPPGPSPRRMNPIMENIARMTSTSSGGSGGNSSLDSFLPISPSPRDAEEDRKASPDLNNFSRFEFPSMFGASVDGIPDNMIMSLSGFSQMGGGSSSLFLLPSASNMNLYGEGGNSRSFFMPSLPPASAPAPAPPPPPEAQLSAPPPAVAPIGTAAPAALADVDVEDLLAAVPYSDDEEEDEDEEYDT